MARQAGIGARDGPSHCGFRITAYNVCYTKLLRKIPCETNARTILFVFKTSVEPHLGEVNYFKVLSGKIKEGDDLYNVNRGSKERLSAIYCVAGQNRTKVSEMVAGDIGATVNVITSYSIHYTKLYDCLHCTNHRPL